ncbi:dihydrolipoamide acetyltransferase family protein [Streptomyces sp. MMS24-I2-30]|uniref:dihydrolipoamide acetyltransferase family protein n=1 Tax=Streptomyces sp. MMS24-I2-30 TaxID=3351564 RepID=UPI003896A5F6
MAQVLEFKLPDLGEGLTEAEVVRWLVEVGDVVVVDQPVVEVETAKAMVEVPCPYGGVVTARFGEEGAELSVGAPLLMVAVGPDAADAPGGEPEGSGNVLVGYGTGAPPARRRRVRSALGGTAAPGAAAPTTAAGTGAVATAPARGAVRPAEGPVPVISPLVRRLARDNGVDLRRLTGSGPDGLILRADVEQALRAAATGGAPTAGVTTDLPTAAPAAAAAPASAAPDALAPVAPGATGPAPATAAAATRIPLKGMRGAVADKLSRSRREIPDATCWVDADATELLGARAAMNAAGGPKISLLALLARVCTAALARFPELNSTVDAEAREIVRLDRVHLGFAAQTERGLVVPVVRDAHARDAEGLTAEFARLTEAARSGTLTPGELTGGTFTLNNYGVFGVDGSTPIINHPEAAMLGVGRIAAKPWVHEGELAVRQVVQLSFTFDHRVCDGGTAGGFLRYVADCVEQPAVLLRTL